MQYARQLIADGALGEITNYRGRFFSMYGSDPLGVLSWRFLVDQAGYGVTTDLMSHSVDLAHMLLGPITRVVGTTETFITRAPAAQPRGGTHYGRGAPERPDGRGHQRGLRRDAVRVRRRGARGTFEASRSIVGPESQMAFEVYGTKGALGWNLEKLNELQLYLVEDELHTGYRTVFGGDRFPYHGHFVPGSANGIGFEDLVVIEDYEFCRVGRRGPRARAGLRRGAAVGQRAGRAAALGASRARWEDVVSLRED